MSGHSKWATIKRQKETKDAKRGNLFTKLAGNITLAARDGGGDIESNFKLRLATDKAKASNMPKENIERAIQRGTGELKGEAVEELNYGALLPGQISVVIKCLTDNKNRTLTDVRSAIIKNGGQFTDFAGIAWQFEPKGVIKIRRDSFKNKNKQEVEMTVIESGADDYFEDDQELTVYTRPEELQDTKNYLEEKGFKLDSADLEMVAKDKKELDTETLNKVVGILDALDEIDEVSAYYTNLK